MSTYQVGPEFHAGDTLNAYPVSSWPYPTSDGPDGVAPTVAATETATVAADSTVTFSALAAGTAYWVGTGSSPYPYLRIVTPSGTTVGGATAANQATANATLTAIDGHVDGLETLTGAVTETAPATDTASSGLNGRLQRIAQRLTSLIALLPTSLGTKTAANSLPVTLSSDQAALPAPADPFGANADAAVAAGAAGSQSAKLRRLTTDIAALLAQIPATLGQKTKANSLGVTIASDQDALPASQSGTWTMQPGNTANTTAWKVDGSAVIQPVSVPGVATATVTQVASSATNVTLQASNAGRRSLAIFNDSTSAVFVKFGTTASSTSFTVKIAAAGYYEVPGPVYTGRIDAIWVSANGNAYVTEVA